LTNYEDDFIIKYIIRIKLKIGNIEEAEE